MLQRLFLAAAVACLAACGSAPEAPNMSPGEADLDVYAKRFVRLALALGEHDGDYVDAYHGPEALRAEARAAETPLAAISGAADSLIAELEAVQSDGAMTLRRRDYLVGQTRALAFRARMLSGEKASFDEESRALYDAAVPRYDEAYFEAIHEQLNEQLPGEGDLATRRETWRARFEIPRERLDGVFRAAIAECERRTAAFIDMPAKQSFTLEYVTDKAWSGYNWFQGDANSLIQINTDLPIHIDRAVDLACHEGYPGHHVYNTLLERSLLKERGWLEFAVFPLFGPSGLIAEGSANYGVRLAFPGDERLEFEREVLFPLAGLDADEVERYYAVHELTEKLSYADTEAARRYLNGELDRAATEAWLVRYALSAPERAAQRVRFFDKYRAYVINYTLGQDIVADFVERDAPGAAERWQRFTLLLTEPWLPSALQPR